MQSIHSGKKIVALVDCNSFYASCEQLFRPDLCNRPVVVLSNNDGVIVARSKEVKKLGIHAYADPYFKLKEKLEKHNVSVFSSNYTLYGDISRRVMSLLSEYSPEVEVYSIDEMFLDLTNFPYDLDNYAEKIRKEITQGIGIPVSVGVSYTKTLSKVANKIAKKKESGVCVLKSQDEIEQALKQTSISDVWGVGYRYAAFLRKQNIHTAYQLTKQDDAWVRKKMTVVGLRMVKELRGEHCVEFEELKEKQQIIVSRSFSRKLTKLTELQEAICSYTSKAAEKLRKQNNCASFIHVHIETPYHNEPNRYVNSFVYRFDVPTSNTAVMIRHAKDLVRAVYRPGHKYMRTGVMLSGLVDEDEVQLNLFNPGADSQKKRELLKLVDALQKQHTIQWGAEHTRKEWQMKRHFLSPHYTTRWSDIPVSKIG
jgi:DNA polymerase V